VTREDEVLTFEDQFSCLIVEHISTLHEILNFFSWSLGTGDMSMLLLFLIQSSTKFYGRVAQIFDRDLVLRLWS
jgi:hypothetical protein